MAQKRRLPEIITEEDFKKLITDTEYRHHKLAYMLAFYQCMRISEVCNLLPTNVDKQLRLLKIKKAKGDKDRNIPIAPEVIKGLKHLPVGIKPRALQIAFKKEAIKTLNRPDLYFHILRHSGVTHYLTKKKWSSLEVQRLAGHANVSTTEIYAHIRPEDLVNRMWEN